MTGNVTALRPKERVRLDAEPIAAIYRDLGTTAAEQVVTRALSEVALTLAGLAEQVRERDVSDLHRQLRRLQRMADHLGMVSLGLVAAELRLVLRQRRFHGLRRRLGAADADRRTLARHRQGSARPPPLGHGRGLRADGETSRLRRNRNCAGSSPCRPALPRPICPSLPLHVVPKDGLADWLAAQPEATRLWLGGAGFSGGSGRDAAAARARVASQGRSSAMARRSRARGGGFPLARAATALPAGDLASGRPTCPRTSATRRPWAGCWRSIASTATSPRRPQVARLKAPAGCDAARIEAIAAGEFLTRDLINTPASDLGPQELEEAFVALAQRHGASPRGDPGRRPA